MTATGRTAESADVAPGDAAATLRDRSFVRVFAAADGDALAASGLLARALSDAGVPFQVGVAPTAATLERRLTRRGPDGSGSDGSGSDPDGDDGSATVVAGAVDDRGAACADVDVHLRTRPLAVGAYEVAKTLGGSPDPVLALAGVVAAGRRPDEDGSDGALADARERGLVDRRPGVGVPTTDLADGLAHSTLVRTAFSGDPDAARSELAALSPPESPTPDDRRAVASLVALSVAGDESAPDHAAAAVERCLRPHATPEAPAATVEGLADVLTTLADAEPGTGVAAALGHDAGDAALSAWRSTARRAHEGVANATMERYDGLTVARVGDAPVRTVARLVADYRSPEPVALVVGDGELAAASRLDGGEDDARAAAPPAEAVRTAMNAVDGEAGETARVAYGCFGPDGDGRTATAVETVREAL